MDTSVQQNVITVCNTVHYGKYGSFYIIFLDSLDTTYPGTKEELKHVMIKVQRKSFGNEQAIYMAGEQTFKKSEKTEVEKQGLLLHQKHYDSGY